MSLLPALPLPVLLLLARRDFLWCAGEYTFESALYTESFSEANHSPARQGQVHLLDFRSLSFDHHGTHLAL